MLFWLTQQAILELTKQICQRFASEIQLKFTSITSAVYWKDL